jgi:hypothetical protein
VRKRHQGPGQFSAQAFSGVHGRELGKTVTNQFKEAFGQVGVDREFLWGCLVVGGTEKDEERENNVWSEGSEVVGGGGS